MTPGPVAGYFEPASGPPGRGAGCTRVTSARGPDGYDINTPENTEKVSDESPAPASGGGGFAVILATAGGAGYAPIAPGTIGSAVGVALFAALSSFEFALYALTVAALGALGTWAADRAEVFFDRTDDGRIVIDEVVGQLVTLAPLTLASARALDGATWLAWVVTGFVLFRVLDVWKPGPVRWAERRFGGGVGVMLDDAIAGALAAGVLLAGVLAQGARG